MTSWHIWLVTRIEYWSDVNCLRLHVQTSQYKSMDANYLLSIMGEVGNVASWVPLPSVGSNETRGVLYTYPKAEFLSFVRYIDDGDIIGPLSKMSYWLNSKLEQKRLEHEKQV